VVAQVYGETECRKPEYRSKRQIEKTVSGCRRSCYFATSHERPVGISTPSKPRLCGEREAESVFVERAAHVGRHHCIAQSIAPSRVLLSKCRYAKAARTGNVMFGMSRQFSYMSKLFRMMPESREALFSEPLSWNQWTQEKSRKPIGNRCNLMISSSSFLVPKAERTAVSGSHIVRRNKFGAN
jgi:hypothetical protein